MRNKTLLRVGRAALWIVLILWTAYGLWNGWKRTAELAALRSSGKYVMAQVIGCERMPAGEHYGYVHYAFNEGTRAIENRFVMPVAAYGDFAIGKAIPVTYLPDDPHTVRLGGVDSSTVTRSAVVSIIFLIAGLVAFGLPLLGIESVINTRGSKPSS